MRRSLALAVLAFVTVAGGCSDEAGSGSASDDADAADTGGDDLGGDAHPDGGAGDALTDVMPADAGDAPDGNDDAVVDADTDDGGDADASDVPTVDAGYGCVADPLLGGSLWPPQATLSDPETLDLEVVRSWSTNIDLTPVALQELRYTSWQIRDCQLEPVRIEAFYAIPQALRGGTPDPAIVVAHGLGGCSNADGAARRAARFGVAAIYYTAPGNCGSTGRGNDDPTALFDTVPDPRGSWFWGHAVAGSRAITVLETFADTDPDRLGMTGYSAGSVATLNVNGFDDRLVAVVPVSGVGRFDLASDAGGWQNDLLEAAGLDADSAEYAALLETVDPINQAPTQHGAVLLVNGAQDEFFPLNSTRATFDAFPGNVHRLTLIPNWDHGLFGADLLGLCAAFDNTDLAARRVEAATRFWLGHHLTGDSRFAELPTLPTAEMFEVSGFLGLRGRLDTDYTVDEVYAYVSVDSAYTFAGVQLEDRAGDQWTDLDSLVSWSAANPDAAEVFTEFRLRVDPLGLDDFWITSSPGLPPDFSPNIRPIDPTQCL